MKINRVIAAAILTGAVGLSGCASVRQAVGANKITPDEFRVVTMAPLVVPPDYALRPPAPGEPRPQELAPESAARQALLGQRSASSRSDGESLLVAKAGGDRADPLARYVVDDEFGDLTYKERSFAERVMFWRNTGEAQASGQNDAAPVDVEAERARLQALTGGRPIVIERRDNRIKLPGL